MKKPRVDDATRQEILRLHLAGISPTAIASQLGLHYLAVYRALKRKPENAKGLMAAKRRAKTLADAKDLAIAHLTELLKDPETPPQYRVAAARALLDQQKKMETQAAKAKAEPKNSIRDLVGMSAESVHPEDMSPADRMKKIREQMEE